MKITFICVGSIKKGSVKEGVGEYVKRMGRHVDASVLETRAPASSRKTPAAEVLKKEAQAISRAIGKGDFVVLLSERGREFTTGEFSLFIRDFMEGRARGQGGRKNLSFVVGGPYGIHSSVLEEADLVLSLSRMTFMHEHALLVLSEQVYRAFTIIKGEPYSH